VIILVRHGETDGNASRVIQFPETPLSERGISQALQLGPRLAELGVAHILVSDYERAQMTAAPAARLSGASLELDPLLRERNLGDLRGRAYSDLGFDPFVQGYEPPGGESWETFRARVARAWQRIQSAAGSLDGNLAVVTHGLVCHVLADTHLALGPDMSFEGGFRNTSVSLVEATAPHRVTLMNCTAHLAGGDTRGGVA
jgi:probable phosphoglycerate mutase